MNSHFDQVHYHGGVCPLEIDKIDITVHSTHSQCATVTFPTFFVPLISFNYIFENLAFL